MPKVSTIILTKDRAGLLKEAVDSVCLQNLKDVEIVILDDGSTDGTAEYLKTLTGQQVKIIRHAVSLGITKSRQEAVLAATGEYVAFLDDDDKWMDAEKLAKQASFLDGDPECVLVGGGIQILQDSRFKIQKRRPEWDAEIRRTMLFRNNFFTSTVMFRRQAALSAGGFLFDGQDFVEDYDLWLRLGKIGKMHNFPEIFTEYRFAGYNTEKYKRFLKKQAALVQKHGTAYPYYSLARIFWKLRLTI